ncbi:hypothetical protein Rs2_04366 [Raphanus sativus]|nr:hypothetical protein Rs2_04366 [Raphanus sativus]
MAGEIGAGYNQIETAVSSETNARTNGEVVALTASAATGAARARMERSNNENKAMLYATKENVEREERNVFGAMTFVSRGEELLKRTCKGDLHWKQVSFNINSTWQDALGQGGNVNPGDDMSGGERTHIPRDHMSGAGTVKRSHILGVKITHVNHGKCVGDEVDESGLADASAPGHNSVNGRERGGVTI